MKQTWRKMAAAGLAAVMMTGMLAGCGGSQTASTTAAGETAATGETTAAAAETTAAGTTAAETTAAGTTAAATATAAETAAGAASGQKFTIGICQLVQHEALDAATKGFRDALTDAYGDNVTFDEQNAAGDAATATQICTSLVQEGCDLIMANGTAALQSASAATSEIPVLGTSITNYGVALDIDNFSGTVGTNVSGTSDLPPLDQQADMFDELLPEAKKIGILYCSAEPNSKYQADEVQKYLEEAGKTVSIYTFSDSNDISSVTQQACDESDALYIPTDNTAASCTETINNVAVAAKKPIIAGEKGVMSGCGIASLSIDYYELGKTTGEMAVKILNGESQVSEMPIEYYQNPVKVYNEKLCQEYGITPPSDYEKYESES